MDNHISFISDFPKLQDMTFNLMVYNCAYNAVYIPNIGYYYQYNEQSVSHRYQENLIDKFTVINKWFDSFIVNKKTDSRYDKAYRERIATRMRTCIVLYFCNRGNPHKYQERKLEFLHLRGSEPYFSAINATDIKAFHGYKERILACAVKYRMFWLCELLCKMYEQLQKRY